MKTLILTAAYGNGHLSATKSICSILREFDPSEDSEIVICEPVKESAKTVDTVISNVYNKVILKHSDIDAFKYIYHWSFKSGNLKLVSDAGKLMTTPLVRNLYKNEEFDLVIQSFPFTSLTSPKAPSVVFVTDYGASRTWADSRADHFFVACDQVFIDLITYGIHSDKISVSGIPVSDLFYNTNTQTKIDSVLLNLGAQGFGFHHSQLQDINYLLLRGVKISVVCGRNEELYNDLSSYFKGIPNVEIYGFVDNMHELLKSHSIVVTKCGGLSLTEAIYCEIPVIINESISLGGQEQMNVNFVLENKIGYVEKQENIFKKIISLLDDETFDYSQVVENIRSIKIIA